MGNPFKKAWKGVTDAASSAGKAIGNAAGSAFNAMGNAGQTAAGLINVAGDAFGNTMQKIGDATGLSTPIGAASSALGLQDIGNSVRDSFNEKVFGKGEQPANTTEEQQKGNEEASQLSEAYGAGADAASAQALANAKQNISAGISRGKAGMLGDAAADNKATIQAINNAARQQNQTTKADYLSKMAQADATDIQARNMNKAVGLNTAGSALQGAAQGMQLGGLIPSDENIKEEDFDKKLADAISQFRTLYRRVRCHHSC